MARRWAFFAKQDCRKAAVEERGISLSFQELEPRIAFDAALGATAADGFGDRYAQSASPEKSGGEETDAGFSNQPDSPAIHDRTRHEASDIDAFEQALTNLHAMAGQAREIVFIDAGVENLDQLLENIDPAHDVILLDPNRDGLEQIAEILATRSDIDAIHLIGHGSAGSLALGNSTLDAASMRGDHADELAVIAKALSENADILIYGCNFAQGAEGQAAAGLLAELTGADVAASDDLTGHNEMGGDWDLEFQSGRIEASIVISERAQHGWFGSLATYTVTNANDTGTGSLRWAIQSANANAGFDTINFNIAGAGAHQINLSTALPTITGSVFIDGTTESDYSSTPLIVLNGQGVSGNGFQLADSATGSTIRGFVVGGFSGHGIHINGADNVVVRGNYIGLNQAGTSAFANGQNGIHIDNTSSGTIIGGTGANELNFISGNSGSGIVIDGGSHNTSIKGNVIGLNAAGNADIGNVGHGIQVGVSQACSATQIGGGNDGEGNIISGNDSNGILLYNSVSTKIQGNRIGTNATGTQDFGNSFAGVALTNHTYTTYIGSDLDGTRDAHEGNIISGNDGAGIHIWGENVDGNLIYGNKIGVNLSATAALGNGLAGVQIGGGADANVVGSVTVHGGNIIGGNGGAGVEILSSGTTQTVVDANYIGTNASGADLGNVGAGVRIAQGASGNVIGGGGNTIRFNDRAGVSVEDSATSDNAILRNKISDNETFAIDLGNDGASSNDVDDSDVGPNSLLNAPVISGVNSNGVDSVHVSGYLYAEPNSYYRIEFYASSGLNANGHVQAQTYIGFVNVVTNASGIAVINHAISSLVPVGYVITATTNRTNSSYTQFTATSELSNGIVANNIAPRIDSNGGGHAVAISIPENTSAVATVLASDSNGETPTYRIVGGADAALFQIDTNSGALTFKNPPVHATPQDSDNNNVYEVTVEASDGKGGIDLQFFSVTVTNPAPVVSNIDGDVMTFTEGTGLTILDQGAAATVTDSDSANFDGGRLEVQITTNRVNSEDILYIRNQGTGAGQIGLSGSNVTYGGVVIGTFSGGTHNAPLVINFNANATPEAAQALLRNIGYNNVNLANPDTATRTVSLTLYDGDGNDSGTKTMTINVVGVNDTPSATFSLTGETRQNAIMSISHTVTDPDGMGAITLQWQRDGVDIPGANSSSYRLTEADVGHRIRVVISYTDGGGTLERLETHSLGPVANVNDPGTGMPVINGLVQEDATLSVDTSSLADPDGLGPLHYQWLRNGINISGATGATYTLGDDDVGAQISIRVSYADGHGTVETFTTGPTAAVVAVNDRPGATAPATSLTAVEQVGLAIQGTGFSISDVDDNGGTMTVRLTVGEGNLTVSTGSSGVTILSGNGTASVLLSGTKDELNALLSGGGASSITYLNPLNAPSASTQISLTVNDGGNTGIDPGTSGSASSEERTVSQTINITPVNDPMGLLSMTITGSSQQNSILTANYTVIDPDGMGPLTVQWQRDGVNIPGANSNSYRLTEADVGHRIRLVISYTDTYGTHESYTSIALGPVANVNDAPTGAPAILGTAEEGGTLTVDTSSIADADGMGSLSYQWLRNGVAISGATGTSYIPGDNDAGAQISVRVSYTDGHGTVETLTSASTAISGVNDRPDATAPASPLEATEQTSLAIQGTGFSISDIDHNGGTMTVTFAVGEGNLVINVGNSGVTLVSGNGTGTVRLSGSLNALNSLLQGTSSGTIIYTNPLDTPSASTQLSMTVNDGGNSGRDPGTSGDATSEERTVSQTINITPVNDVMHLSLTMTGETRQNGLMTANYTVSDADGLGPVTLQWQRDGADIPGANGSTYRFTEADVGHRIRLVLSYTDAYGTLESFTSIPMGPVANVNDAPTGAPVILGTAEENQTLNVDVSSIADADGMGGLTYQWLRNGVEISGATGSSYLLGDNDVGARITVRVSYVDGHGTVESLTSVQTASIANVNDVATGRPNISGILEEHQRLHADTSSISDIDGMGAIHFQWYRDGQLINGANDASYQLTYLDIGTRISVRVSFTDSHGSQEQLQSAETGPVAKHVAPVSPEIIDPPAPVPEEGGTGGGEPDPDPVVPTEPETGIVEPEVEPEKPLTGNENNSEKEEAARPAEAEKSDDDTAPAATDEGFALDEEGQQDAGPHDNSMRFQSMNAELRAKLDVVRFSLGRVDPVVFYQAVDTSMESLNRNGQVFGTPQVKLTMSMGAVLSAGFVTWALRGGAILSALMSTMPAWRGFDPMIILSSDGKSLTGDESGDLTHAERVFDVSGPTSSTKSSSSFHNNGVRTGGVAGTSDRQGT